MDIKLCMFDNRRAITFVSLVMLMLSVGRLEAHTRHRKSGNDIQPVIEPQLGKWVSPDGKFILIISGVDESSPQMNIFANDGKRHNKKYSLIHLTHVNSILGFAWIHSQPHTLVFAVHRWEIQSYIGLWRGGHVKILSNGTLPKDEDPDAEYFELTGVEKNGRYLKYTHYRYGYVDTPEILKIPSDLLQGSVKTRSVTRP